MKPANEIRVLVVEDDPFFQRVLQKRLGGRGLPGRDRGRRPRGHEGDRQRSSPTS